MTAKEKFLAECDRWADLLIGDAKLVHRNQRARDELLQLRVADEICYKLDDGTCAHQELPESQRRVWQAGLQLLLDAYDEANGE